MFPARIVRQVLLDAGQDRQVFSIDGQLPGARRRLGRFSSYEAAVSAAETAGLDLLYGWSDEIGINREAGAI